MRLASSTASTPQPRSAAFQPLYRQIKTLITQALRAGEWKPGMPIPSETELAARFGVSQGTVRKAIEELAAENVVVRRQGKGTFVASHGEPRAQFRFLRLRPDGGEAAPLSSEVLGVTRLRAPPDVARPLGMRPGENALCVRRLLSDDGRPVVLDEIWLPAAAFRRLTAERLAAYRGPLYALFESEFGTRMIRCDERIKAVAASAEHAAVLRVAAGTPVLFAERLSYSYDDRPVEVRRGWYVTSEHHYLSALA